MRLRYLTSVAGLLALGFSVAFAPAPVDYEMLDASGNPLRTAFNEDLGKVRVIMLVAPT